MLPEEWLKKYAPLAEMGARRGGPPPLSARAGGPAGRPARVAARGLGRRAVRQGARRASRSSPASARRRRRATFRGELRPYQEAGLGWLAFLRQFGFGGCLADDMGLGKTIQVLAMLAGRPRRDGRPSIVVVPKSLVWNWEQEAARFAPKLRVLAHVGSERAASATALRRRLAGVDLLVTTYGVLRKDAVFLREIEADYVILDEAQAIKNADSESAKAARLLRGDHRLALSGTPIENHLGELWSLIEFLNPGMLGTARAFAAAAGAQAAGAGDAGVAGARAAALHLAAHQGRGRARAAAQARGDDPVRDGAGAAPPLRRAAHALPRAACSARSTKDGLGKSKIQVLEALLRLRQVACHPGLVDKKRAALGQRKAGRAAGAPRGGAARGPQGAGVLAVHELPGLASATDSTRPRFRTSTWTAPRRIARRASPASRPTTAARCSCSA